MPLTFTLIDDLAIEQVTPPDALVEGVLRQGGVVMLAGPAGSGKTFVTLDLAFAIATGRPWLGRFAVKQGPVVYVAAEGTGHLPLRVQAWKRHNKVDGIAGVYFLQGPVQLGSKNEVTMLLNAIKAKLPDVQPRLIVIDTLARCSVGADENLARDMGMLVAGMDRIRTETTGCVLAQHHTGHDTKRERGSSALRAALDTAMLIGGDSGGFTLTCERQKDGFEFDPLRFTLQQIILDNGKTSCVVQLAGTGTAGRLTPSANTALEALTRFPGGARHGEWLKASGLKRATFNNALKKLLDHKRVHEEGNRYSIVPT